MPLIQPIVDNPQALANASRALESIGLVPSKTQKKSTDSDLKAKLEDNNLGVDDLLSSLSNLAHGADSDSIRIRAIEDAMKLHPDTRIMDSNKPTAPVVNIIINDGQNSVSLNPILFPREALSSL